MITDADTEEHLGQFVEEYARFGVLITNHKTKLARRVYLMILFADLLIMGFLLMMENESFKQDIQGIMSKYIFLLFFIGVILLVSVILLPEKRDFSLTIILPIWIITTIFFSGLISYAFSFYPESPYSFCIFLIHQIAITILVFGK